VKTEVIRTMKLEGILREIYSNDIQEGIEILNRYDFYNTIQKNIDFLNKDNKDKKVIKHLVGHFLHSINQKLLKIDDLEDKMYLKIIISDVGLYLIKTQFKNQNINIEDLKEINNQLKYTCEIEGYDFEELQKLLGLDQIYKFLQDDLRDNIKKVIYFEWLGKNNHFDEIVDTLKTEGVIRSKKEFKKLFTENPVNVRIDIAQKDFLIIFIDYLKESNLLTTKPKKGHLLVLRECIVDDDKKRIFKKEMKHEKYRIKKNAQKYNELRRIAKNWAQY